MNKIKSKYPILRIRSLMGLFMIISFSCFVNVLYYTDIRELNDVTIGVIEHSFIVSNSVRDVEIYINAMYRSMKDVISSENETELNNSIHLVKKNEQLIYDNFEIVKEKFLGDLEFVNDAYAAFVKSKYIRDTVIDLVKNGDLEEAQKTIKKSGNNQMILLFQKINIMIESTNKHVASFNQNSLSILLKAKRNFFLSFITFSILGTILFVWIFYSLSTPIDHMINRIKNVSGTKIIGFPQNSNNRLAVLDFAISELENREKILEENINSRTNELIEARNTLESSIENANIGIVTTNLDGRFMKVNQYFCDFIGYTRAELLNLKYDDFTKEEDKAVGAEIVKKVIDGKIKGETFDKAYIHKSGTIIYGSVSISLVRDDNNNLNKLFAQIRDVTELKLNEIELSKHKLNLESTVKQRTLDLDEKALNLSRSRQALTFLLEDVNDIKKQLEVSNLKLNESNNELEAFSYSVSHDLKAPLRAVIGFSQILKEDFAPQLDPESKRFIGLIKDNAENMATLINDLLNYSRMARTKLQKSEINLCALGQRVKSELMIDAKDRELTINILDMPVVNADEKLIYHVMQNLISNAVKFTSNVKGAIVEVGCACEDNVHVFYVKDNGVGFNMKYAGKIFDVFQRLHTVDEFPGTGIGLSIVQRIIYKHEGKVWVESELNKGTTFFFTL